MIFCSVFIIFISSPFLQPDSTYGSVTRAHNVNLQPGIVSGTRDSRNNLVVRSAFDTNPLLHVSTKIALRDPTTKCFVISLCFYKIKCISPTTRFRISIWIGDKNTIRLNASCIAKNNVSYTEFIVHQSKEKFRQ